MNGLPIIDIGAVLIVLLSGVLAYARGFMRETLSILGWLIAALVALHYGDLLKPLILEIPVLSDILVNSCDLAVLSSAFGVFTLTLITAAMLTPLFAGVVQRSALSGIDQGFGFLFGITRGVVLILAALVTYSLVGVQIDMVDQSSTQALLQNMQGKIENALTTNTDEQGQSWSHWAQSKYAQLTAS